MTRRVRLDDGEYALDDLPEAAKALVDRLTFAQSRLQDLHNHTALLKKAKNGYIEALKLDFIRARTGVFLEDIPPGDAPGSERGMNKLDLDGVTYDLADLSPDGRAQLETLQFLESQLQKIEQEMNVYRTARLAYLQSLKNEIERAGLKPAEAAASGA